MEDAELEHAVLSILSSLGSQLSPLDHKSVEDFIKYKEYALALETLCDQIGERSAILAKTEYEILVRLADFMRIDPAYVEDLPAPSA